MSQAPPAIHDLVEQFDRNRDEYRKHGLNETQLRREYLDPFFEARGWDVANRQGHAPAYREVIHEDAVKIGGVEKAPIVYSEADDGYIADIPDLAARSAFGKTPAEALKQAQIAKRAWLEAARAEGKPIPKPRYRPAIYQTGS
jgi:predicted RNase H-like HicB family nuclease